MNQGLKIIITWIFYNFLIILFAVVATSFIPGTFFIALIAFITVNLLYVYLVMAPNNVFFTFVPTETVKFVVSGGQLVTIFCSSLNYALDSLYNIVDEATGEFPDDDYGVKRSFTVSMQNKERRSREKTEQEKEAINSIIEKEAKKILDKEKGTIKLVLINLNTKGCIFTESGPYVKSLNGISGGAAYAKTMK